jgi:ABC-type branched-subunit amino acid transport system ATPase component
VADDVADRLVALKETGVAVVAVDQDIVRCREIADRLYFMYSGRTSGGAETKAYEFDELPLWKSPAEPVGAGTEPGGDARSP